MGETYIGTLHLCSWTSIAVSAVGATPPMQSDQQNPSDHHQNCWEDPFARQKANHGFQGEDWNFSLCLQNWSHGCFTTTIPRLCCHKLWYDVGSILQWWCEFGTHARSSFNLWVFPTPRLQKFSQYRGRRGSKPDKPFRTSILRLHHWGQGWPTKKDWLIFECLIRTVVAFFGSMMLYAISWLQFTLETHAYSWDALGLAFSLRLKHTRACLSSLRSKVRWSFEPQHEGAAARLHTWELKQTFRI